LRNGSIVKLKARLIAGIRARWRSGLTGAGLTILCGLVLWRFPIGDPLIHLSYDLPFLFSPKIDCDDLIIIRMDEQSYRETGQEWHLGEWSRALHAELLQNLKRDQSGVVVFDLWFAKTNKQEADDLLAQAIKSHGAVVLPAIQESISHPGLSAGKQTLLPIPSFLEAATNWGISELPQDTDLAVRQHFQGTELYPSLPWAAAVVAKPDLLKQTPGRSAERWIRYYGTNGTIPSLSYFQALKKPNRYFENKTVFIGGKPGTRYASEIVDDFRTPYTAWTRMKTPGVEINATIFLNLIRGDWLSRLSWGTECLLLALGGLVLGYDLAQVRPMVATWVAALAFCLIMLAAVMLVWTTYRWFSWMIVAGAQVPCALAWSVLTHTKTLSREKEVLSHQKEVLEIQLKTSSHGSNSVLGPLLTERGTNFAPAIHDHTLLRRVGKGAYGEVWLAVNAIGLYHAVKIVDQRNFDSLEPYTREFKGMQKYMPISLNHPGLVHILHVGRDDQAGYFYYVMEVGDDEVAGIKITPETYSARNLARDLGKRGRLPIAECVSLGIALTDALEFLHQQQLVHRDIKPSNIIFVNGLPKLADIGLVTDIGVEGKGTYVGTPGYIPPDWPGTPAADVYSMGKVLYEAATGLEVHRFPELPSTVPESAGALDLIRLNSIILQACENDRQKRYQSAAELRGNLLDLKRHLNL